MVTRRGAERQILVAGASGLIGHFIVADLARCGHGIVAVARRLEPAQKFGLRACTVVEVPIVELDTLALARLINEHRADVVVNCIGVLQDSAGASTHEVHEAFVGRLVAAIRSLDRPVLLAHIGVPGREGDDRTAFSLTKRRGEHLIRDADIPFAILRPGFVVAPAAYGGSALLRALSVLPIDLPAEELGRPFAAVAVEDVAETVAFLVENWAPGDRGPRVAFDLVHPEPPTVRQILGLFRLWLGEPSRRRLTLPKWLLDLGAYAGDCAACLGWTLRWTQSAGPLPRPA